MTALIVDDEQHCRESLELMIRSYSPVISEIRSARSVDDALEILRSFTPAVLFLDVQMPEKNGFHLLDHVDTRRTSIIFTTAHEHFAMQAVQCGPTGYVLKPIDPEELMATVDRAVQLYRLNLMAENAYQDGLRELYRSLDQGRRMNKICLSHGSRLEVVELDHLVYLSSDDNYTTFHLDDNRTILVSKTIKTYENLLGERFMRIHRSHIVNLDFVRSFNHKENYLHLAMDIHLPVSRRNLNTVVNRIREIHRA